jgi:hypothetical protein
MPEPGTDETEVNPGAATEPSADPGLRDGPLAEASPPSDSGPADILGFTARELGPVETRAPGDLRPYRARWVWPPRFRDRATWQHLRQDIARHGVRTPLTILPDGDVIDGGHRLELARELGLASVPVRLVHVSLPLDDVERLRIETGAVWEAVARRQLDPTEIDATLLDLHRAWAEGEARPPQGTPDPRDPAAAAAPARKPTAGELAEHFGVSPRHVERVARVARLGSRTLHAQIRAGEMSVTEADRLLRRPSAPAPAAGQTDAHRTLDAAATSFVAHVAAMVAESATWPREGREGLAGVLGGIARDLEETSRLISDQGRPRRG